MTQTRPPEPITLRHVAKEAREKLREFDHRLDLWWDAKRGSFAIMEWMRKAGVWSHTLHWEGGGGEYRSPLPITPLLEKLKGIDWDRYIHAAGVGPGLQAKIEDDLDRGRRQHLDRRRVEQENLRQDYVQDCMKRASDFLPGTGGAKLRAWKEARAEHREATENFVEAGK
jgi:hypothetical protein